MTSWDKQYTLKWHRRDDCNESLRREAKGTEEGTIIYQETEWVLLKRIKRRGALKRIEQKKTHLLEDTKLEDECWKEKSKLERKTF